MTQKGEGEGGVQTLDVTSKGGGHYLDEKSKGGINV